MTQTSDLRYRDNVALLRTLHLARQRRIVCPCRGMAVRSKSSKIKGDGVLARDNKNAKDLVDVGYSDAVG